MDSTGLKEGLYRVHCEQSCKLCLWYIISEHNGMFKNVLLTNVSVLTQLEGLLLLLVYTIIFCFLNFNEELIQIQTHKCTHHLRITHIYQQTDSDESVCTSVNVDELV